MTPVVKDYFLKCSSPNLFNLDVARAETREIGAGADEDIYCILVTLFDFYLFDSSHFIRFVFTFLEEALIHQLLSKGSRA